MKCRLHDSSRLQESYCFLQKFNIMLCNCVCALFFNEERERINISDPMFCDMITTRKAKCVLYYNAKTLPVSIIGMYMLTSCLLHVTREFNSVKLICRNLYAIFSHVKKAYTANQNGVQLFSHVDE